MPTDNYSVLADALKAAQACAERPVLVMVSPAGQTYRVVAPSETAVRDGLLGSGYRPVVKINKHGLVLYPTMGRSGQLWVTIPED